MTQFFSVDTLFFTILGYPMSYIEFVGTVLYVWSVWLISQRKMLTWPIGMISVVLYMVLFYQIRLYADAAEQIYYLAASVYGWWHWAKGRSTDHSVVEVSYSSSASAASWAVGTGVGSVVLGVALCRVHLWMPGLFPEEASFPFLDALTTVMSFVAMWLMARKRTESWIYWIIVDVIGIGLYAAKDVKFISLLYVVLLALAIRGWIRWMRTNRVDAEAVG